MVIFNIVGSWVTDMVSLFRRFEESIKYYASR